MTDSVETRAVETPHGTVSYETVDCWVCGESVRKRDAHDVFVLNDSPPRCFLRFPTLFRCSYLGGSRDPKRVCDGCFLPPAGMPASYRSFVRGVFYPAAVLSRLLVFLLFVGLIVLASGIWSTFLLGLFVGLYLATTVATWVVALGFGHRWL